MDSLTTPKSVLYLASNPSLCGCMKFAGANKDVCLRFYPTILCPLDASPLLRNTSKEEIDRVINKRYTEDEEYNLHKFIDVIQSSWDKVVVWREDRLNDELLMMLIAKFTPREKYPLYEVVLDEEQSKSYREHLSIKELNDNIDDSAKPLSATQLDELSQKYDLLLEHDTGLHVRNNSGEIANINIEDFYPIVYSIIDDLTSKGTPLWGRTNFSLMMMGYSSYVTEKVLFTMAMNGLIHLRYEKSKRRVKNIPEFWKGLGLGKNAIIER